MLARLASTLDEGGSLWIAPCDHASPAGTPLDWVPDRFMNADGSRLMCHTHGALFRIEDGHCIAGPCAGDALRPLAVEVDGAGQVILALE